MKTDSWREALDVVPAEGREGYSMSLLDISEFAGEAVVKGMYSLEPCFT